MRIAGVDEAGRGPLVGPVVAAAVILDPLNPINGLKDSKKLSESKREALVNCIFSQSLGVGIGLAEHCEIDAYNILNATMLAMQRAVFDLPIQPDCVLIDGNRCPKLPFQTQAIVKGDAKHAEISAASIVAKVTRDRMLKLLDSAYPVYGFGQHKGYGTKQHLEALKQWGPVLQHRKSFKGVVVD